jgi:polar amino acid transport system substrate-binding protein
VGSPTARWAERAYPEEFRAVGPLEVSDALRAQLRGCGGPAFRFADSLLASAWNRELAGFVGSGDHHALVRPFGFGADELPDWVPGAAPSAPSAP